MVERNRTKKRNQIRRTGVRALALPAVFCALSLCMTSCGVWNWLWERDYGTPMDSADLIVGTKDPSEETHNQFEGAVEYLGPGSSYGGTDIYYKGQQDSPNEHRIIVIDAGHQAEGSSTLEPNGPGSEVMKAEVTWGATGVSTGQSEYELNLRVALLLRDELIRRGYSVVMIRETNDVNISNMERAQIANKYEAAAYVRIHANSWTEPEKRGALAISHSSVNPYCADHYRESSLLSQCILDAFCQETGHKNLGVTENDTMTGTNWSQVPTTIVEMGFLSNPDEDRYMTYGIFRVDAAKGIANGLDLYFELTEPEETSGAETREASPWTDGSDE